MEYHYVTINDCFGARNVFKIIGETKLYYKVKMHNGSIEYLNKKTMRIKGEHEPWHTFYYKLVPDEEAEEFISRFNDISFLKGFEHWGYLHTDVLVKIVDLIQKDMKKE